MATTVDERIVAAKFDASDFEKGVDKTVKKLDELKKSLDLKDATKSVQELAEKTEVSTNSMSKSLEKLTDRFTTFTGMIKQKILGGLADEVANVFLRMERSVKNFISSISSQQVNNGLYKYEQMLTSVRVMMSAGETENSAYKAIESLQLYSDQTSYSLSQMTDALSKLRAAGVDLDTATKTVEGIANACARAGINANDAQRAFYNLSQAYSSGTLKYTDYRSLELLNMTTEDFKEQMLEAAVAAGTLKKTSEGVYKTVKTNKKVTKENLKDALRYDIINKEAMNKLFGETFFFDEKKMKEAREKYGDDLEAIKKEYGKVAVEAYLAAREARSFTDVVNTLKDVVSTGWSTTFQHLFGKLGESTKFFTELAEGGLADAIYKIGEYRNAVLGYWDDLDALGRGSGGEVLRQSIINITEAIGTLIRTIQQVLPGFDELYYKEEESQPILEGIGDSLFEMTLRLRKSTMSIKEAAENFNTFMNSPMFENGPTRIETIRRVIANLASVFGIIGKVVSIAFVTISKVFHALEPVFDGFLVLLQKITQPLSDLKNDTTVFKNIEYSVNNIVTALEPLAKILGTVFGFLGDIGKFLVEMSLSTITANISFFSDTLGILFELITGNSAQMKDGAGILDGIRESFEGIKEVCITGLDAVKKFFSALIGDVRELLGLTTNNVEENQNGGIFSRLINFFNTNEFIQDAKAWVDQAIIDIGNFINTIPERVYKLGENIFNVIWRLFFYEKREDVGGEMKTNVYKTDLAKWFDKVIEDIIIFIKSIPNRIIAGISTVGSWIDQVFNFLFGNEAEDTTTEAKNQEKIDGQVINKFDEFINNTVASIREWFADLPNKVKKLMRGIGNFSTNLLNVIDEFLFGKKAYIAGAASSANSIDGKKGRTYAVKRIKTGFSKWLDGVISEVRRFVFNIPAYVQRGIKGVGDIISTVVNAIFGTDKEVTNEDVEDKIEKPFRGINLSGILNTIKEIGLTIINQVARIFTGTEDIEQNQQWFSEKIAEGIEWIRTQASLALHWVLDFLANLPTKIAKIFKDEDAENVDRGPIGNAIHNFGLAIGKFISDDLPETVSTFISNAVTAFGEVWNNLYEAITGNGKESPEEVVKEKIAEVDATTGAAPQLTGLQKFSKNISETISNIFRDLPTWVAQGLDMAIMAIDSVIKLLGDSIGNLGVSESVAEGSKALTKDIVAEVGKSSSEGEKEGESKLKTAIESIGERLKTLFVTTIPGFIQEAWKEISSLGTDIYNGFATIFTGEIPEGERAKAVAKVGMSIRNFFIEKFPGFMQNAWTKISSTASQIFNGFASIFTGSEPQTEIENAVNQFGTTIYTIITKDIPDIIKKAFDYVSNLFKGSGEDDWKNNIVGNDEMYKQVISAVENQQKQADEQLGNASTKSGFWTFVDKFKESFLSAFDSIGPAILNGLATALQWIGKIATYIMDLITGNTSLADDIETAFGEEKPELRSALKNIGESLRDFFLETIPKFIGSAIGSIAKKAPEWFAQLFGAMEDAAEDEASGGGAGGHPFDEAVESATGVIDIVSRIFNGLKNWVGNNEEFLQIMAVIIVLSILFRRLTELFSLGDEMDAVVGIVKWGAITVAISAIAGLLSAILDMVKPGNEAQLNLFKDTLKSLGEVLTTLAWIVGLLSAGKLFEALDTKFGKNTEGKVGVSEKFLAGLSDAFTGFFKAIGIGAGVTVAADLVSSGIDTTINVISESIKTFTAGMGTAADLLVPFTEKVSSLTGKIDSAISVVTKTKDLFGLFYGVFNELYYEVIGPDTTEDQKIDYRNVKRMYNDKDENLLDNFDAQNEFYNILSERLDLFIRLSTFINNIADALNKLQGVPDIAEKLSDIEQVIDTGDFGRFLLKLFNSLNSVWMMSDISAKSLSSTQYIANARNAGIGLALELLSDSLSIFANSITGLNPANVEAFEQVLQTFVKLAEMLDEAKDSLGKQTSLSKIFTGDRTLSAVGSEIKMFGYYMREFYKYVSEFPGFDNEDAIKKTQSQISSVTELATALSAAVSDAAYGDLNQFSGFGQALPEFGNYLGEFIRNVNTVLKNDGEEIKKDRIESIATAVHSVADLLYSVGKWSYGTDISDVITSWREGLTGDKGSEFAATIRLFIRGVAEAIKDDDSLEAYRNAGSTIASALMEGIQSALDEDPTLRPKIVPVFEIDRDAMRQQVSDSLGLSVGSNLDWNALVGAIAGANAQVDQDRIDAITLNTEISRVTTAIGELKDSQATVSDVTNAFSRMRIITDTGVLVGVLTPGIDAEIGKRIWQISRGVTT